MRLLVCGDRFWTDRLAIRRKLEPVIVRGELEVLIEGEAPGADIISREVALELGFPNDQILMFPALWHRFSKAAGNIRNTQMLVKGQPTDVWAFHDRIEDSVGTKNMVRQAEAKGIRVWKSWEAYD